MRPFFQKMILDHQPFKPMIIVVDTTKAGSASNTFVLPIIKDVTEVVKIEWGDGTSSIGATGDNTHVYTAGGVYTVKIYAKIFGEIYFTNTGDRLKLISVVSNGDGIQRALSFAYYGCTNLTSFAAPLKHLATTVHSIFRNCTSLTSAPLIDLSKVTNMTFMFLGCSSLTSVPKLTLSSATLTISMFNGCTSLTNIPPLDLSKVTDATNMFAGVTLTTQSYSDFLVNLATLSLRTGVTFSGGNSKYSSAGATARAYIISTFGWTITDGGAAP